MVISLEKSQVCLCRSLSRRLYKTLQDSVTHACVCSDWSEFMVGKHKLLPTACGSPSCHGGKPTLLLSSWADEPASGDISSKAAAYVAFGLIRIAGAFCVTKAYGVQDKLRRRDLGMQAFI